MFQIKIELVDTMFDLSITAERKLISLKNLERLIKATTKDMLRIWEDYDDFGIPKNFRLDVDEKTLINNYTENCTIYNCSGTYELTISAKRI